MINIAMDAIKAQRTSAEVAIGSGVGVVAHAAVMARVQNVTFGSRSVTVGADVRRKEARGWQKWRGRRNRND